MGTSTTPAYRVEFTVSGEVWTPHAWRVGYQNGARGYGQPTCFNLARHVARMVESFNPGGANYRPDVPTPFVMSARIIRQRTGDVVASYRGPSFQAL